MLVFHVYVVGGYDRLDAGFLNTIVSHGWLGVQLFFVLSGFLLFRAFAAATIRRTAWPAWRRYARARVLRILPAYWAALSIVIVLRYPAGAPAAAPGLAAMCVLALRSWRRGLGRDRPAAGLAKLAGALVLALLTTFAIAAATITSPANWWLYAKDYLFLHLNLGGGFAIAPSWTLCIEVMFYVTLPLIALGLSRLARAATTERGRAVVVLAALAAFVPLGAGYQALVGGRTWDLLPGYLDQFAIGMALAVVYELREGRPTSRARAAAVAVAAVLVGALGASLEHTGAATQPWLGGESVVYRPLMAASFALVLAAMLLSPPTMLLPRLLRSRPFAWLGVVSYGVFLWHLPILHVLVSHDADALPYGVLVLLVAALAIGAAALSWRLVERPALALKDGRSATRPAVDTPLLTQPVPVLTAAGESVR